jgi:mRNA interferase HigB
VRILAKKTLKEYWEKHSDCANQLKNWYKVASKAEWNNSQDIKKVYSSASFLANNRVIFNIKGNDYRLVTEVNYDYHTIWILFLGTHAEYDTINFDEL